MAPREMSKKCKCETTVSVMLPPIDSLSPVLTLRGRAEMCVELWSGRVERSERFSNSKTQFDRHLKASSCYRTFSGECAGFRTDRSVQVKDHLVGKLFALKKLPFLGVPMRHGQAASPSKCVKAPKCQEQWQFAETLLEQMQLASVQL